MIRVVCSKCGHPWTEREDICHFFNHRAVHDWIDGGLNGIPELMVRPMWTMPQIEAWLLAEVELIARRTVANAKSPAPA